MSQHTYTHSRFGLASCVAVAAGLLLLGTASARAQWASKPAPPLPHSLLDQAQSGSVLLNLVFDQGGHVREAQIVRSSGVAGLDKVAQQGALRWRLDPSAMQASDTSSGRQHLVKFFQNANVSRRVEPITAFWKEL
ncbi:MAG: energy transducer TonB [Verrucomicrobiota bacterium]|nr:energy transducer TonB [Verrucomicrobiota bacterium]